MAAGEGEKGKWGLDLLVRRIYLATNLKKTPAVPRKLNPLLSLRTFFTP